MDKNKLLELALVEWIALLKSRDRSKSHVKTNFEDLFQKWKDLEGSFDDLYDTLLPKAIKAHQPLPSIARSTYKTLKSRIDKSEKEFIDEWNDSIEGTGLEAFFEFFPATSFDKDEEPKVYGNMSATEYRAQRRYADQFPTLNTDELIKQWKEQKEYNLDVEDTL
ncbi:hypothetical protein EBR43_14210, partial [bacterium]|nr:hypothetical protein [bacterium]